MSLAFAAFMGWCGTRWPGWIWELIRRWPKPPIPEPDPWPWYMGYVCGIIGAIGGIVAVKVFAPELQDQGLAMHAVTAFFGGVFGAAIADPMPGLMMKR